MIFHIKWKDKDITQLAFASARIPLKVTSYSSKTLKAHVVSLATRAGT